jgi:hypothetical protein
MHTSIRLLAAVAVAGLLSQPSLAWAQPAPDIRIAMTHTGNFTVGVNGIYTIVVSNGGSTAFSGRIDVIDQVVTGLEGAHFFLYVSAVGAGWSCSYDIGLPSEWVHCFTSSPIAAGGSAPAITLTVLPTASGTWTNIAQAQACSSNFVCTSNSVGDVTIVLAGVPTLPPWALIALTVCLALAGVLAMRRRMA